MPDLDYYLKLIPPQHRDKPKFISVMTIALMPYVEAQHFLASIPEEFDIDYSIGVQLDQDGEWVGRTRYLNVPIEGVFFAWGEEGVGWSEGKWKSHYDADTKMAILPDDVYRRLLKAKIAANQWDGTIPGAYSVWQIAFEGTGHIVFLEDHQDMSMTICIAGKPPDAVMRALLTQGYLPLKPEGVRIKDYLTTLSGGPFFAWGCESEVLRGWGEGHWPVSLYDYHPSMAAGTDSGYLSADDYGNTFLNDVVDENGQDPFFGKNTVAWDQVPPNYETLHARSDENGNVFLK